MANSPGSRDDSESRGGPGDNETEESKLLHALSAEVRDQDELEQNINREAEQLLAEQENERERKRLEKAVAERTKLLNQIKKIEGRLNGSTAVGSATAARLESEQRNYEAQLLNLEADIDDIQKRIKEREQLLAQDSQPSQSGSQRLPHETKRDFLLRTGKITPFSKIGLADAQLRDEKNLQDALLNAEKVSDEEQDDEEDGEAETAEREGRSHRILHRPGFEDVKSDESSSKEETSTRPTKSRRLAKEKQQDATPTRDTVLHRSDAEAPGSESDGSAFDPQMDDKQLAVLGDSDVTSGASDFDDLTSERAGRKRRRKADMKRSHEDDEEDFKNLDDGDEKLYQRRVQNWVSRRSAARRKANSSMPSDPSEEEWYLPHPTIKDTEIDGAFKIPGDVYPALFDYQKTGVQWLWELYSQKVGGIVGDEMGLGKTIQIISFLAGLHYSKLLTKPVIVVAPVTVMRQWVNEFHTWWPALRVSILHSSGSGIANTKRDSQYEDELLDRGPGKSKSKLSGRTLRTAKKVVDRVVSEGHVLVTSYAGLQTYAELLIPVDWEYAVLDEGHKIRNPNAGITLFAKELRTPNRVILSGTPIQNNLIELWSLFDFIFPMRLGNLIDFKNQFEIPIRIGGYANASNLQVQTASRCAETLKDAISPYLLQRIKADVAADLPQKRERVLFCKLTKPQRQAYEDFLKGDNIRAIYSRKLNVLYGVDILRKICNHPDLQDYKTLSVKRGYDYGTPAKSGKMVVVKELLDIWRRSGHKTLLFAQHRIMLDILEIYVKSIDGLNYRRMDGNTAIGNRQALVDEFNGNPDIHVFLLTTKVGGLGVNLTGADRVIIFDPDWNPSTDIQARERAWRLGQKREVEIYRLMVAGTIEEKIFHRQIFKQLLTNKILRDPSQRQTFQMQDLHDLFTLGNPDQESTETGRLFEGSEVKIQDKGSESSPRAKKAAGKAAARPKVKQEPDEDLSTVQGVSSIQPYEMDGKNPSNEDGSGGDKQNDSDQRILEGIFARSGVHSAFEHDKIVNGKRVIAADPSIIRKEAQKVADEAARELQKSEQIARSIPAGTPTWTGQFGIAGRPGSSAIAASGKPASSMVLANLQERQRNAEGQSSRSNAQARNPTASTYMGREFLKQIRDFLTVHGGKAYTQMLINHFNHQCTTPQRTAEFKAMLRKIATLQKGSNGRGAWILKDEYKAKQ